MPIRLKVEISVSVLPNLAAQLRIVRTGMFEEGDARAGINFQRGVKQIADLPISFGRHMKMVTGERGQEGTGFYPVTYHLSRRVLPLQVNLQHLRGFLDAQAAEESHLYDSS